MEDLSDDLVSALLELPDGLMQLTTVASTNHNVSNEHLLRSSHSTSTNNPSSSETFNVLIDSGCSVSCTGFKEDFHGKLAMGNFGYSTPPMVKRNLMALAWSSGMSSH
eukprot:scaffold7890_cov74-Amphora_coffeaeformis.AAC.1